MVDFCEQCGIPLGVDARFCAGCGHGVESASPTLNLTEPPLHTRTSTRGRLRATGVFIGSLVAVVAVAGVLFLVLSNGSASTDSPAVRKTTTSRKASVAQWLGRYHNYVDEVQAKWGAGPDVQGSTLGQQEAEAMRELSQSAVSHGDEAAAAIRAQIPNVSPQMRPMLEADAAQREADGRQIQNAAVEAARVTGAAQEFCRDMMSLLRDKQAPLFPSPNRQLDRALGAWIDSTVAYFGTCPLVVGNADASARLASVMVANRNAVDRLVGELRG